MNPLWSEGVGRVPLTRLRASQENHEPLDDSEKFCVAASAIGRSYRVHGAESFDTLIDITGQDGVIRWSRFVLRLGGRHQVEAPRGFIRTAEG